LLQAWAQQRLAPQQRQHSPPPPLPLPPAAQPQSQALPAAWQTGSWTAAHWPLLPQPPLLPWASRRGVRAALLLPLLLPQLSQAASC
jgi:hypothetical protein